MKNWNPDPYQVDSAGWLVSRKSAALWADPGLGKTSISCAAISTLKETRKARRALVVAPMFVATETWPEELSGWREFSHLTYRVLRGKGKHLDEAVAPHPDVFILNYEALSWFTGWDYLQEITPRVPSGLSREEEAKLKVRREAKIQREFRKGLARLVEELQIDIVVLDEVTRVKSTDSKTHFFVREMVQSIKYRWGLTGSPAANSMLELFGQLLVIDDGQSLGEYITHYRGKYFEKINPRDPFSRYVLRAGGEEGIYKAVSKVAKRLDAADYIKLPEVVTSVKRFNLTPEARKVYSDMEVDLISTVREERMVAGSAVAALNKCRQITGGALYRNPVDPVTGESVVLDDKYREIHDEKLSVLDSVIEGLNGQQVIVVYWFQHELERMQKRYPDLRVLKGNDLKKTIADWNAGKIQKLALHPQSAAHGLNLQRSHARHIVLYSTPWSNELYIQLIARLKRRGNESATVFVHQLVARDTVDEVVTYDKIAKSKMQDALFAYLKI